MIPRTTITTDVRFYAEHKEILESLRANDNMNEVILGALREFYTSVWMDQPKPKSGKPIDRIVVRLADLPEGLGQWLASLPYGGFSWAIRQCLAAKFCGQQSPDAKPSSLTAAQQNAIAEMRYYERTQHTIVAIMGDEEGVRVRFSDGESFVILPNGDTCSYSYF